MYQLLKIMSPGVHGALLVRKVVPVGALRDAGLQCALDSVADE
jgi:hypothetical protein